MAESVVKTMDIMPDYLEKAYKDLLANVFKYDEETGEFSGIATESPLYGKQVYQAADGSGTTTDPSLAALDEAGKPVSYYKTADGTYTTDASLAELDQFGNPIYATEGGVAPPTKIGFTDLQQKAIDMLMGEKDPVTGEYSYSGLGAYKPYLDMAEDLYKKSEEAIDASTAMYDPRGQIVYETVEKMNKPLPMDHPDYDPNAPMGTGEYEKVAKMQDVYDDEGNVIGREEVRTGGYKDFYDPFVEDVIDTTLADLYDIKEKETMKTRGEQIGLGAFGGSRGSVADAQLVRDYMREAGSQGSKLRSEAFNTAMGYSTKAFEDAMTRGQTAGQLFQDLGTGIGALGEAAQALGFKDVNAAFNVGSLEQGQLQAEYDAERQAQLEEAYEPFALMGYAADMIRGIPVSSTGLTAAGTPQGSPTANVLTDTLSLGGGSGLFSLGAKT